MHLPVLEEVVEDGEDVPLRLLDPLQHQHPTLRRCLHRALEVDVLVFKQKTI